MVAGVATGLLSVLTESMCYLSAEQESLLRAISLDDVVAQLPGWVSGPCFSRSFR
eukprot:COSAG02_NODE_1982_length_10196_cov_6.214816_7_plen_55_part_00